MVPGGLWTRHRHGVAPFQPEGFAVGVTLRARVLRGNWVVICETCSTPWPTRRDDKRFFCVHCLNARAGGQWIKVVWPRNAERGEAILLARPVIDEQNWGVWPPDRDDLETIAELIAENREHRDPVPEGVE